MTVGSSSVSEQNRLLSQLLSIHLSNGNSSKKKFHNFDESDDVLVEVSDQVPAGRGLVFTRHVEPGQVLLTLHPDSLINVKSFKSFLHPDTLPNALGVAGSATPSDSRLSSSQLLSLLIARAKVESELGESRRSDDLTPKHEVLRLFVQTLPVSFDTVPLAWSLKAHKLGSSGEAESVGMPGADSGANGDSQARFFQSLLQALPRHSRLLHRKVRGRFEKDWSGLCQVRDTNCDLLAEPALLATNPDLAWQIVRSIGVDTFLWAWLCVNSRCVFLPLGLSDHADNFTLAPMLDMANHTPDPAFECKVRYAKGGGLELCVPTREQMTRPDVVLYSFRPGEECFITYGPHSNEALLSEYGFVLPAKLFFLQHASMSDGYEEKKTKRWRGSRYVDVLLDDEVERFLEAQGTDGAAKIELLQNRGYWGEFTIHPCPEPAHPSHRLVPALRLAALSLETLSKASHAPNMTKAKAQSGVKSRKTPFYQSGSLNDASDLGKWEETLTGYRDNVSDENEQRAHSILADLCATRRKDTEGARHHLLQAQALLENLPDSTQANGCALSLAFVKQLLDEEEAVLDLVVQAAGQQVEW